MPRSAARPCNSSQTVTGTLNLDSFGNQVGSTGSSGDPYTFAATSRYRSDGDAGLTLVGARYYDGQVGRFISRDTLLTQKPYLYCNHDPANKVDPSGHGPTLKFWVWVFAACGVAGTIIVGGSALGVGLLVIAIVGGAAVGDKGLGVGPYWIPDPMPPKPNGYWSGGGWHATHDDEQGLQRYYAEH